MSRRSPLAVLFSAALIALAVPADLGVAAEQPATSSASTCSGADDNPFQTSVAAAERATLCLLNRERKRRGIRSLRSNSKLAAAAERHSRDMARRDYFDHDSRDGTSFSTRVRRAGYARGSGGWYLGENIAWGSGPYATPRSIVSEWMRSPGHKRNILDRRFREIGVGIARGAPVRGQEGGVTYTTDFGSRG